VFQACWTALRSRVDDPVLDTERPRPLDYPVEAAGTLGEEVIDEKFQKKFTEQLERANEERLQADISGLPADDRRRIAYAQVDAFSRQFVASMPSSNTFLMAAELRECFAAYMGLPSPACAPHVGKQVAGKPNWTLDEYGDILTVRNLPGRQQTIRHDTYKWCISRLMGSFPHECEAMELFTASILDPAFFSQPARNRARQGVVPDFLLQPPSGRQELMDVKTVSFCPTRYPAAILDTRHAAVSRRASAVHREMHAKARKVDRRWNGTAQGAQGPVERRMQEFGPIGGLVVGAFGEASADVLTLIQRTALFNAERNGLWRCMGASSLEDGAKVLEKRAIRTLGVEGVRGLARARLANLSHVCSNYRQSGPNRGREKAYYENARQAHYERFGPRAYYKSGRRQHSS
jgi:hypothetical protein